MDIDEEIRLEANRHYRKIKELKDILDMYNNNARENTAYVDRNVDQAASYGIEPDRIVSYDESRRHTNPYAAQIEKIEADIKEENELHERNSADLRRKKQEIEQQRMEDELARERKRHQREIELIRLQQEINRIENEILEIEERLRTISMETLGSYFSKQIAERYPEEYQRFQQSKEQVRKHRRDVRQTSDLKERFSRVSADLKLYQDALPVYESYYQRYQEMSKESQQQRAGKEEQAAIYNLIHAAENERLQSHRSLYTALDLGNKTIHPEYQGMTYEQETASIEQKEAEEKARQEVSKPVQQSYEPVLEEVKAPVYDEPIESTSQPYELKVNPESLKRQNLPEKRKELDLSSLLVEDKKKRLVSQIVSGMDPLELQYTPLPDVKKRLMEMPTEELENILSTMQFQNEQTQNNGMHR